MSRKTKIIAAVVGLLIIGGVVAAVALGLGSPKVEVQVADAMVQDLAVTVMASGAVDTGVRADVFPSSPGTIVEVLVTDGASVQAGTVLASLDTAPLDANVAAAKAGLAQAEAQMSSVINSEPGDGDAAAAHAATTAAWSAYQAALAGVDAAADGAPSSGDLAAANAATNAAWQSYDAARAAYDLLEASVEASAFPSPMALAELQAARASRDQAYAGFLQAKSSASKLVGYSSSSVTAQAQAAADQAYAGYAQARSAESKLNTADTSAQRAAAQAAIEQARLGLIIAEENRAKAKLTAPIDGVVLFNAVGAPGSDGQAPKIAVGAAVAPSAPPFTVVDMNALRFRAEVDEVDVDVVDTGMIGVVSLDAFPESFEATVSEIRPAATLTATGGTVFPVYLIFDASQADVLIGMKGDTAIEVDSVPNAVTIPVEALFDEGGDTYVYKVVAGELQRTKVAIGTMTDTDVEITSGVESGERVALSGPDELVDGMRVRVRP